MDCEADDFERMSTEVTWGIDADAAEGEQVWPEAEGGEPPVTGLCRIATCSRKESSSCRISDKSDISGADLGCKATFFRATCVDIMLFVVGLRDRFEARMLGDDI